MNKTNIRNYFSLFVRPDFEPESKSSNMLKAVSRNIRGARLGSCILNSDLMTINNMYYETMSIKFTDIYKKEKDYMILTYFIINTMEERIRLIVGIHNG